jgi:hypothetical protein
MQPQAGAQPYGNNMQKLQLLAQLNPDLAKSAQQYMTYGTELMKTQVPLLVNAANRLSLTDDARTQLNMLYRYKSDFARAGRPTDVIDQGIKQLQSGDTEGFNAGLQKIIQAGQQIDSTGIDGIQQAVPVHGRGFQTLSRGGTPSFRQLPEDQQALIMELEEKRRQTELEHTKRIEQVKGQVQRTSEKTKEMNERNTNAVRQARPIREALQLASKATQGVTGVVKLRLAKLFPDIDVSNEAALESTLHQLSLEQLAAFPGTTTDFEYGVTQKITGEILNSKEANLARLNSLDRARWFNEREVKQYRKHIKDGGTADDFTFDMNEIINTKTGDYTIELIRNTAADRHISMEDMIRELNK